MPKAIITGATGYIGSHVAKHLLETGWSVGIIVRQQSRLYNIHDVLDRIDIFEHTGSIHSLADFLKKTSPNVVIHLAAATASNPPIEHIQPLISSNIEFPTQLLEAMCLSNVKHFISTGSYWQNYNSDRYNPVDLYAATKEACEAVLKYYTEVRGIRAVTLRLFDVYGEDDPRPKLWQQLHHSAQSGNVLDMSAGEQSIDLVHISDIVQAYETAYHLLVNDPEIRNEVYGVSSGKQLPLRDIVSLFQSVIGKHIPINWGARPYRTREVMHPYNGYKTLPGWHPTISLEEGFAKFIK